MSDFLDLHEDSSARLVLYAGALLLMVIPFLQAGSQLWPLQLSNIQWRYGAANALSSVLLLPFLGLSILVLMARGLESRPLALITGSISAVFALGLMASLGLFVLDAQQLKAIVSSQMSAAFTNTTVRVGLVTGLFLLAFLVLTLASFRAPRGKATARKVKGDGGSDEGVGLIVGQV